MAFKTQAPGSSKDCCILHIAWLDLESFSEMTIPTNRLATKEEEEVVAKD
jgi:hypothetical protein